ncbi:hypothetical protein [Azonexus sp.]|uniref:hypothetical protein n=1 Tax=Azonexus sp. TaxID=1872668 RepID=UPI0035B3376F
MPTWQHIAFVSNDATLKPPPAGSHRGIAQTNNYREVMMKKLLMGLLAGLFSASLCFAQATDCESKAVSKDGKPLAGAAKASFMKKCQAENKGDTKTACEAKAKDKNGKALAGAAKTSFMKKCEAGQ